ncbi:MAG: hypothetical protein KAV00_02110 [Phycisphaerae bacterium]|nr:hypothetical protein [Phycisphaerae bacterium]
MRIRCIRAYQRLVPGDVVDWNLGVADLLIRRGFFRKIGEVDTAAVEPAAERAVRPRPRKRKGRQQ